MVSNGGMTATYADYLTYAKKIGVAPYTQKQWDTMAPTQRILIGIAIARSAVTS